MIIITVYSETAHRRVNCEYPSLQTKLAKRLEYYLIYYAKFHVKYKTNIVYVSC